MSRYDILGDGEAVTFDWRTESVFIECCDCSLVHRIWAEVETDQLHLYFERDEGETRRIRLSREADP